MYTNHIYFSAHYIYLSFPEANDWTNIRDGRNNVLSIGQFSFKKKGSSSYTDANNACDVLAMFYLMSFLQLEDYHVTTIHSNVTDTGMMTFFEPCSLFFSENGTLGWDVPSIKQLCTSCVTYKKSGTMESFPRGKDTLQTRTACGSITGYSFNLFTQVLVFPVKLTWMKSIPMESPCTTSNMSRGINSSEPWMMNWLETTSRFTMNIHAFGIVWLGTQIMPVLDCVCIHYV